MPRPLVNTNRDDSFLLVIDDEEIELNPTQLLDPGIQRDIDERCRNAEQIIFRNWARAIALPEQQRRLLIQWATDESSPPWQFAIGGSPDTFDDPFTATLALSIDADDLRLIGQATSTAIMAASAVCPEAAPAAAGRIRDWLQANGIPSASVSVIAAQIRSNGAPSAASDGRVTPQDAARRVLARLQAQREEAGETEIETPPVRYYQGDYHRWDGRSWVADDAFEHLVVRILQEELDNKDLTSNFINSVCRNIQSLTLFRSPPMRLPLYVRGEDPSDVVECRALTCRNGLLDMTPALSEGRHPALGTHDPRVFGTSILPYDYDATVRCPLWLGTLGEIFPRYSDTDHRVSILQQYFGYCLLPWNHRFETFVILVGNGANGKSVALDVLRGVLGCQNVSDVPLDAFAAEFRLADMIGKLANIATDMQRMPKVQEGVLKQLVSGEAIQINRKYRQPVTMFPTAKLIFATNHLPPFADTSDGLWRRVIVIPFYEVFSPQRRDRHRAQRIIADELPGVLNWAIEGAVQLLSQGDFTQCELCEQAKLGHRHDSDPFLQFLDECCEIRQDRDELVDDLYAAYRGFCEAAGKKPKAKSEFGKQMANIGINRERELRVSRRHYVYRGIGLLPGVLAVTEPLTRRYQAPSRRDISPLPGLGLWPNAEDALPSPSPETTH